MSTIPKDEIRWMARHVLKEIPKDLKKLAKAEKTLRKKVEVVKECDHKHPSGKTAFTESTVSKGWKQCSICKRHNLDGQP